MTDCKRSLGQIKHTGNTRQADVKLHEIIMQKAFRA